MLNQHLHQSSKAWCTHEKVPGHQSASLQPTLAATAAAVCTIACIPWLHYLTDELYRVADIDLRRRLRSASTSTLVVPPMHHSTTGDRAFPVAALHVWNSLLSSVTCQCHWVLSGSVSNQSFFVLCGPDCVWWFCSALLVPLYHAWLQMCPFIVKCSCSPRILWHFNHIR